MRKSIVTSCKAALCVAVALCAAAGVSGCRESDALTELINDQTSQNVDYDNPTKLYNNTPDAELTSEDYPQMEESKKATIERERKNVNAVQGKDVVDDEVSKSQSQQSSKDDADGSEADEGQGASSGSKAKDSKGKRGGGAGGDSADESKKGRGKGSTGGAGGTGATVDLSGSEEPKENAYDTVAAFGECANIVMMLAGEGSLAGSDAEFLDNDFVQDAYKDEGIGKVREISVRHSTSFDVSDVIKSKAEAVFVMNGTYEVSKKQQGLLKKADIDIVYLPDCSSHDSIVSLVKIVGTLFGDSSETKSGKDAKQAASAYGDWANGQVRDITRKNGGLTTYGGLNYNTGKADLSKAVSNDPSKIDWTLYVSDWDADAVYSASPNRSHLWDAKGLALTKTGYTWSPLSYYMSVGGVNNNAAQFHVTTSRPTSLYYIWQFNLSYMSTDSSHFKNVSITPSKLENFSDNDVLVRTQDDSKSYSLGSDNFRNVIVKSQKVKKALESARDTGTRNQRGLYAAYDYQDAHGQTGIGLFAAQNVLVPSFIGYESGTRGTIGTHKSVAYERFKDGKNPYEVVTNPHGLYSSWADGSVESVLECSWIYDLYHGDDDYASCKEATREFYHEFYDYDLRDAEVDQILAGLEE